jgi:amino acid permease
MIALTSYMPDYAGDIARYANPPNHELEQMIWLAVIIGFVMFLVILKKYNPDSYEKITNIIWGVIGVILLGWLYNNWKNKDKE